MLEIDHLVAGYGGVPVLHDISVTIGAGEIVGLLGANNAGKTTLINALSGMVKPMSGRILFQGDDISRMTPHGTRRMRHRSGAGGPAGVS